MIVKRFDNGWGPEYPVKKFEIEILKPFMCHLESLPEKVAIINSTWYTNDYHQTTLEYLRKNSVDVVVLIAMIDPAIPKPEWFAELGCKIICVGYYPGEYYIDFWALFMGKYFDSPHLTDLVRVDDISVGFLCLNRKPHWHRRKLYDQLCELNLLDQGLVSMGSETGPPIRTVDNGIEVPELTPNSDVQQYGISNDIVSLGELTNWKKYFLNVITETVYGINTNHFVSEKIFKPILGLRPFLVFDPDGATAWLGARGFENYTKDFTDITDLDLSDPDCIAPFLQTLCQQSPLYWQKKLIDLNPKIMYNKQQFYKYVDDQSLKITKGILCPI
jgi:hypothetical protein